MKPQLSYTIWFSQHTGSTLLCKALESTRIAGRPQELLNHKVDLLKAYNLASHAELQEHLWKLGSTANRVFGMKHSFHEPNFSQLIEVFRNFPNCPPKENNHATIWEYSFPNHHHIFMTRRNKVRLAVSWWKAIQTQQWYLQPGTESKPADLSNSYSFDAIDHLYKECSMREAGIQEFFTEGNITPMNIFYEDFIQRYEQTIRAVLDYLELDSRSASIAPPTLAKTADAVSEGWAQRFREELQNGWTNRGW